MKALIACHGESYPFTHKLDVLLDILMRLLEPLPATPRPIRSLTAFAVDLRYDFGPPLTSFDRDEVRATLAIVREHILARILTLESTAPAP